MGERGTWPAAATTKMKLQIERALTPMIDNAITDVWRRNCAARTDTDYGDRRPARAQVPTLGLREAGEDFEICWSSRKPLFILERAEQWGIDLQWKRISPEPTPAESSARNRDETRGSWMKSVREGALGLLSAVCGRRRFST
jgi:hypothetical protein